MIVTCLSTRIFNVTYNKPTILKFENNETSEKIFLIEVMLIILYLMKLITIKKNTKNLDDSKEDQIIQINDTTQFIYIRYYIKDNEYLLYTNLFDFDIETLKIFYHKRWSNEEYFKLIKKTTNINKNNEVLILKIQNYYSFDYRISTDCVGVSI